MPKREYEFPPEDKRSLEEQSFFCLLHSRGYVDVDKGDHVLMVRKTDPKADPLAKWTLGKLGVPPCRFKVEEDTPVPEDIVKHWRNKDIEVEPVGVIRARFRGSETDYIYPYRIKFVEVPK